MLNHLMNSERAARDAFLSDDYFNNRVEDADKIDGLVDTFTFLVMTAAIGSAAIVAVIVLI